MSPVSASSHPKSQAQSSAGASGGAAVFAMQNAKVNEAEDSPVAGPDGTMPGADKSAVPASELLALLDRSARTDISPTVAPTVGKDGDDAANPTVDDGPQPTVPVAPPAVQINPFAALLAAAPVVVQVVTANDSAVDDGVQAAKLPEMKAASRAAAAFITATSTELADLSPFGLPKSLASIAEQARKEASVDTSVTMLSDTALDADSAPTFSLPAGATATQQLASASSAQPVAATDIMINRHLDLARGDAWLDTLAQDIAASAGSGDRLRFGLSPEHLGRLDVEVSRGQAGVAIHMTTRSEEARAIIAAAQPRLVDELRANGTRVATAEVSSQLNAQTNGQSGGASRPYIASFIESAAEVRAPTLTAINTHAVAAGRYA